MQNQNGILPVDCSHRCHVFDGFIHDNRIPLPKESQVLVPIMMFQLVLLILIYFVEKSKNLQAELADVNTQLVQQEERQRIARDLHDTIGHTLTMIKVKPN